MAEYVETSDKQVIIRLGAAQLVLALGHEEIYRMIELARHSQSKHYRGAGGALTVSIIPEKATDDLL